MQFDHFYQVSVLGDVVYLRNIALNRQVALSQMDNYTLVAVYKPYVLLKNFDPIVYKPFNLIIHPSIKDVSIFDYKDYIYI